VSGAELFVLLQSYLNAVHSLGPNALVVVAAYPLQCDIFKNSKLKWTPELGPRIAGVKV
jgi:hypothetical protein